MNTRIFQIPALLLGASVGFAAAAQAPPHDGAQDWAQTQATSTVQVEESAMDADAAPDASDEQARRVVDDRTCLRETGSRLIRADRTGRKCANATGRSYSREDLERTGMSHDLGGALRMLDSSIN